MEYNFVVFVAVALFVTVAFVLIHRDAREVARTYEQIRNLPAPTPQLRVSDLDAVDVSIEQPPSQVSHVHVWGASPNDADATSRTYRCQVPHCPRVHTIMR